MAAKTKFFWTKQKHHAKDLESSATDVLFYFIYLFIFWLLKGVFGFGGIGLFCNWLIISTIQFFVVDILTTLGPIKFKIWILVKFQLLVQKKQSQVKKNIFVEKKEKNNPSNCFYGNAWLNTFFHQNIKNPKAPKTNFVYSLEYFKPFCSFKYIRHPFKKKSPSRKNCV